MRAACVLLCLTVAAAPMAAWSKGCHRARGARMGEPAPCTGVILPMEGAKRCARASIDLRRCGDDLAEWKRRAEAPLPTPCTPTILTKIKTVTKPRPVWHVAVAAVVGFAAGAYFTWRATQ